MVTKTLTITSSIGINFQTIDVVDTSDYTGATINSVSLSVYKPGSTVPVVINLLTTYTGASDKTKISYSVTLSQLGLTTTIYPDGEYQLIWNVDLTVSAVHTTGALTGYILMYGNCIAALQPRIANIADIGTNCSCDDDTEELFEMYMQLQSAIFSHDCGKYLNAQNKITTLTNYINSCGCGC